MMSYEVSIYVNASALVERVENTYTELLVQIRKTL
jgi:hypothetical protein